MRPCTAHFNSPEMFYRAWHHARFGGGQYIKVPNCTSGLKVFRRGPHSQVSGIGTSKNSVLNSGSPIVYIPFFVVCVVCVLVVLCGLFFIFLEMYFGYKSRARDRDCALPLFSRSTPLVRLYSTLPLSAQWRMKIEIG